LIYAVSVGRESDISSLLQIDPSTGDRATMFRDASREFDEFEDVLVDDSNVIFLMTDGDLLRFERSSGQPELLSFRGAGGGPAKRGSFDLRDMSFVSQDTIAIGADDSDDAETWLVDKVTGDRDRLMGLASRVNAITFHPEIGIITANGGQLRSYHVDVFVSSNEIGSGPSLGFIEDMVSFDNRLFVLGRFDSSGAVFSVDPVTGDRTEISGTGPSIVFPSAMTVVPVPEPTTLLAHLFGVTVLLLFRHRSGGQVNKTGKDTDSAAGDWGSWDKAGLVLNLIAVLIRKAGLLYAAKQLRS
jgi:hypothetical protein